MLCREFLLKIGKILKTQLRLNHPISTELKGNIAILDKNATLVSEIDNLDVKIPEKSVIEECQEDISHVAPFLRPTFNFAAYINKSETLQELIKLGVNLHKFEKNPDIPPFILKLDFQLNVRKYVEFFHGLGLQTDDIGHLITKNPLILKEDLDNLQVRLNYLKCKKFKHDMIVRIVQKNPSWLSFSTQDIDKKLGFFQKQFQLSGNEVRFLAVKMPKLITYDSNHIKLNYFVVKEEMGFDLDQIKHILLETPTIFIKNQNSILKTFEFVHQTMNIPDNLILKSPQVLTCRSTRIKERHLFLETLNKAQYNPKKTNYVSLLNLISGTDAHFSTEIAGSSIQAYNTFLKTL